MLEPYNILYRGVLCSAVDWSSEPKRFVFTVNNNAYIHEQVGEYNCKSDTDHILFVIDEFIAIKSKQSGAKRFDVQLHFPESYVLNAMKCCQSVSGGREQDCSHCEYNKWSDPLCKTILHKDALLLLLSNQNESDQSLYSNYRRENVETDIKQNAAYWDQIDWLAEGYVRNLLQYSYPPIQINVNEAIEIGKFVTEFTVKMLEERCKAKFPVVGGEY